MLALTVNQRINIKTHMLDGINISVRMYGIVTEKYYNPFLCRWKDSPRFGAAVGYSFHSGKKHSQTSIKYSIH